MPLLRSRFDRPGPNRSQRTAQLAMLLGAPLAASGLTGCSTHQTQRASLEYRPLVVEPAPNPVFASRAVSPAGGGMALTSVFTE